MQKHKKVQFSKSRSMLDYDGDCEIVKLNWNIEQTLIHHRLYLLEKEKKCTHFNYHRTKKKFIYSEKATKTWNTSKRRFIAEVKQMLLM